MKKGILQAAENVIVMVVVIDAIIRKAVGGAIAGTKACRAVDQRTVIVRIRGRGIIIIGTDRTESDRGVGAVAPHRPRLPRAVHPRLLKVSGTGLSAEREGGAVVRLAPQWSC